MNIPITIPNPTATFIYILIVIIGASVATRVIAYLMNRMKRFHDNKAAIYLMRDIINYVIYFIALMTILQFFGINLAGILLSLGIVGIGVSFAAKDIISNLFSGIILIVMKSIQVGDTIEIKNNKGVVEMLNLRSTILVDDGGIKEIIPNSTLITTPYLHYRAPEKYRIDIQTGLALNIDIEEFKEYITKKISEYDWIVKDPEPVVNAISINNEESNLKVSFWVKDINSKSKYKLIITNEIRKYIQMGEKNE